MGSNIVTKRSAIVLAMTAALLALVAYKAEAADSFKLTQTVQDKISCTNISSTLSCTNGTNAKFAIAEKVFSAGFDLANFTTNSDISIVVGGMTNLFRLSEDPNFVAGKNSATIVKKNGGQTVATISLKASTKGLAIKITGNVTIGGANPPPLPISHDMMSHSGWRGTVDLSTGNTTADVLFSNSVTGVTETSVDLTLTGQTKTKSGAKAKDGQTFDLSSTTMKGAPSL